MYVVIAILCISFAECTHQQEFILIKAHFNLGRPEGNRFLRFKLEIAPLRLDFQYQLHLRIDICSIHIHVYQKYNIDTK